MRAKIAGQKVLYERLSRASPAAQDAPKMRGEIKKLETQHQVLLQKVRTNAPGLLQLVTADTAPLAAVQQAAAKGGYDVLEYVVLPAIAEFAPELVLVSAGFDAHRADPSA